MCTVLFIGKKTSSTLFVQKQSVPMSINDFVEMTTFLCLICFSIYPKIQSFVDECAIFFFAFYTEIQDGCQKWLENDKTTFWEKSPVDCQDTLWVETFVKIALSSTVIEKNVFFSFYAKIQNVCQKWREIILGTNHQ